MRTQVAIVGGGPAGSTTALHLAERGIDVVVIEEDVFPRFHVGESMTGWAAERVRALGLADSMRDREFPVKYAGTVYGTSTTSKFDVPVSARVDESERREVPTWQVRRATFDQLMLDTALSRGADLIEGKATEPHLEDGVMRGVTVKTCSGGEERVESDVVIDASGRKTWLSGQGVAAKRERGGYENQIAIYSHMTGAVRNPGSEDGNTLLFYKDIDYWAWFIPIDPDVVSIGIVTPSSYFKSKKERKEDFYFRELRELNPNLAERVEDIELVEEVHATANFSYRIPKFTGPGWMCVGDAHRFIDPFFSFGIHLAMSEAEKAADFIEQYLQGVGRDNTNPFSAYELLCDRGMDVVQDLMDAFWANPLGWGYLLHFTEHKSDILDIFGGRIYDEDPLAGLIALRKLKASGRSRLAVAAP